MRRTNIYLSDEQTSALDEASRAQGVTRAELVRRLIDRGLGAENSADLEADLAAIRGAFGVAPEAQPAVSRDADARARHLDQLHSS